MINAEVRGRIRSRSEVGVKVDAFDFNLPEELIAQHAAPRGESRLLVLDRAPRPLQHSTVRDAARPSSGPAICSSRTTPESFRPGCSATACRAAARSSVCCWREEPNPSPDLRSPIRRSPTDLDRPDAPRAEAEAGRHRRSRATRAVLHGGGARAAVLRAAAHPAVGRRRAGRRRARRRDGARAAAAVHPSRRHAGRSRALPDGVRGARAARSPRRPRGSTSTRRCSRRSRRAGVRARDGHAARRLRHVQAGPRPTKSKSTSSIRSRTRFRRRRPRAINGALDKGAGVCRGRDDDDARARGCRAPRRRPGPRGHAPTRRSSSIPGSSSA